MNCKQSTYNKGNYWFKRLVNRYPRLHFKEHRKYPFADVYYKSAMYNLHILSVPLRMNEMNTQKAISRNMLNKQSTYDQMKENGKVDDINNTKDLVRGYRSTVYKIDKRFYLLRNHSEFLQNTCQRAKNML